MSLVLVDTSVWARRWQGVVGEELAAAIEANQVVQVAPIVLELLRSARDEREHAEVSEELGELHEVALTRSVGRRARHVQHALARRGYHRGPSPTDLLAAAAAEAVGAELWHCDRHFELIADVTGQAARRLGDRP